jgi:hypothetical protein
MKFLLPPSLLMMSLFFPLYTSGLQETSGSAQSQERATDPKIATLYNSAADSFGRERGLWLELGDSFVKCRPSRCRDAQRPETMDALEKELTERLKIVKRLRAEEAEFSE